MTILNKLEAVSSNSVTPISALQKAQDISDDLARQTFADGGKSLPAQQQDVSLVEARRRELGDAVKHISGYIQNITRELKFSVDEELGETVVTVIDETSGNIIRQIPSVDMIALAKNMSDLKERAGKGILLETDA